MASRMDEFREFVNKYPLVRNEVLNGKKTWQQIYEDWVIMGENNDMWREYAKETPTKTKAAPKKLEDYLTSDNLKTVMGYIKKINPDSLSKTLNTVQKVLQITQSFGGGASSGLSGLYNANYNSWWD